MRSGPTIAHWIAAAVSLILLALVAVWPHDFTLFGLTRSRIDSPLTLLLIVFWMNQDRARKDVKASIKAFWRGKFRPVRPSSMRQYG